MMSMPQRFAQIGSKSRSREKGLVKVGQRQQPMVFKLMEDMRDTGIFEEACKLLNCAISREFSAI